MARPVHTNQHACQVGVLRDRLVDAICLSGEVRVQRANHDSTMSGHLVVKRDKVLSVDGQDGPVSRNGTAKNGLIRDPAIGVSGIQSCKYFVSEFPELHDCQ
jgi:hypothetical protein